MTDSCWFPQVIRGEYALNVWNGMKPVWNGHGTDTQRNVNFGCIRRSGMEGSRTEFETLFRSWIGVGLGCALALVPDLSY